MCKNPSHFSMPQQLSYRNQAKHTITFDLFCCCLLAEGNPMHETTTMKQPRISTFSILNRHRKPIAFQILTPTMPPSRAVFTKQLCHLTITHQTPLRTNKVKSRYLALGTPIRQNMWTQTYFFLPLALDLVAEAEPFETTLVARDVAVEFALLGLSVSICLFCRLISS